MQKPAQIRIAVQGTFYFGHLAGWQKRWPFHGIGEWNDLSVSLSHDAITVSTSDQFYTQPSINIEDHLSIIINPLAWGPGTFNIL